MSLLMDEQQPKPPLPVKDYEEPTGPQAGSSWYRADEDEARVKPEKQIKGVRNRGIICGELRTCPCGRGYCPASMM
jgi:hypothetical protein